MIPDSLPCIACGSWVSLVSHAGRFSWTDGGIWMLETGNYGSAVLDDPPDRLAVFMVLCDGCLAARRSRMRAVKIGAEDRTTCGWEWLDEVPGGLVRGPEGRAMRAFACPTCRVEASGLDVTSARCVHGPMFEKEIRS